jgi:hypothetical protein
MKVYMNISEDFKDRLLEHGRTEVTVYATRKDAEKSKAHGTTHEIEFPEDICSKGGKHSRGMDRHNFNVLCKKCLKPY